MLRILSIVVIAVVVSTAHTQIDRRETAVPAYAIASGHPSQAYPPIPKALSQRVALSTSGVSHLRRYLTSPRGTE